MARKIERKSKFNENSLVQMKFDLDVNYKYHQKVISTLKDKYEVEF